jgi:hypothetical protein
MPITRKAATRNHIPAVPDKPVRIDCGSGYHYGICPVCRRGHGYIVFPQPSNSRHVR